MRVLSLDVARCFFERMDGRGGMESVFDAVLVLSVLASLLCFILSSAGTRSPFIIRNANYGEWQGPYVGTFLLFSIFWRSRCDLSVAKIIRVHNSSRFAF